MTTGYGRHETQMVEVVMDEKGSDRATFSVVIERDNASLTRRQSEPLGREYNFPSSGNSLAVNVGPRYFKFRNDVTRGGGRTPELLLNTRPSGRAEDLEEDQHWHFTRRRRRGRYRDCRGRRSSGRGRGRAPTDRCRCSATAASRLRRGRRRRTNLVTESVSKDTIQPVAVAERETSSVAEATTAGVISVSAALVVVGLCAWR